MLSTQVGTEVVVDNGTDIMVTDGTLTGEVITSIEVTGTTFTETEYTALGGVSQLLTLICTLKIH